MTEPLENPSSAKSGESGSGAGGGSRFSQFFSKPASGGGNASNLAKLEQNNVDELGVTKETFTSIKIPSPGDPSAYFAPISPAAKTENPSNPIMDLLRGGSEKTESKIFIHFLMDFEFYQFLWILIHFLYLDQF